VAVLPGDPVAVARAFVEAVHDLAGPVVHVRGGAAPFAGREREAVVIIAVGALQAVVHFVFVDAVIVPVEPGAVFAALVVARPMDNVPGASLGAAEPAAGAGGVGGPEDHGARSGRAGLASGALAGGSRSSRAASCGRSPNPPSDAWRGPRMSRSPSAGLRRESTGPVQAAWLSRGGSCAPA